MESWSEVVSAPLLPFKILLPKLGSSVPFFGSGWDSESTHSREHQEHGVTGVSSQEGTYGYFSLHPSLTEVEAGPGRAGAD